VELSSGLTEEQTAVVRDLHRALDYGASNAVRIPRTAVDKIDVSGPAFLAGARPPADIVLQRAPSGTPGVGKPLEMRIFGDDDGVTVTKQMSCGRRGATESQQSTGLLTRRRSKNDTDLRQIPDDIWWDGLHQRRLERREMTRFLRNYNDNTAVVVMMMMMLVLISSGRVLIFVA
jgi:hypothetical protein